MDILENLFLKSHIIIDIVIVCLIPYCILGTNHCNLFSSSIPSNVIIMPINLTPKYPNKRIIIGKINLSKNKNSQFTKTVFFKKFYLEYYYL